MVDIQQCIVLLLLVGTCLCTSTLSIMIERGQDECFYISKASGETITASFQVMHGDSVDFTLLDPKREIIYENLDSDGYELEQQIHIGGDYGFCFANSARYPTGVHFEYDFHLGSPEEAQFKKKLDEEKRRFLMNKIKENQPKVIGGHGAEGVKPVEMHHGGHKLQPDELEMDALAHAMLLISFNADRMEHFMNQHKSKQAFSHNVQMKNAEWINYYSVTVITLVIIMSLVQVIVVKSFFSGKINLKVWEF